MRDFGGLLIGVFLYVIAGTFFVLVAWASMGCATQVATGPGCSVIAEVQTGTTIRCVEIERASVADSIEETGKALGGLLRGIVGAP